MQPLFQLAPPPEVAGVAIEALAFRDLLAASHVGQVVLLVIPSDKLAVADAGDPVLARVAGDEQASQEQQKRRAHRSGGKET